jgi:hypothetical protein
MFLALLLPLLLRASSQMNPRGDSVVVMFGFLV